MRLRTILIIAALLIILAAALAAWAGSPRVVTVNPLPGSEDLPGDSVLQVTFSRPVSPETLEDRLVIEPEVVGFLSWTDQILTFIPEEPWPSGQTITVTLRAGLRAAEGLGLPVWGNTTWHFQVSEILLAYLWPANDLADLYTLNPLSGEVTQRTVDAAIHDYTVSPDGKAVFYTVDRLRGGSDIVRLSLKSPDTAAAREVVASCENAVCRNPAASPNGRWLAYEQVPESGGRTQIGIWLLDLLDGTTRPVDVSGHPARNPAWSAAGWLAFYDLTDQAYRVTHLESGYTLLLPNQIGEPGSWHPQGEKFLATEFFEESSDLLVSAASGHLLLYNLAQLSDIQDLTREYYLEDVGGLFAPSGQQIAFTRKFLDPERWTAGRQVWVMDLPTSDGEMASARQLTDDIEYNHYGLAWSPDSQQIAYMRFNLAEITQLPEIWLVNADGSNPIELVKGGYGPQWVP